MAKKKSTKFKVPVPVAYSNEPVLTTEQLANFYGCSTTQIKQNFNNNKERFVEGKHYFKVEGEALAKLRVENFYLQISPMTRVLYLWTRRGAARHAKMLNTEKAWEVFEALEEFYFDSEKFLWSVARLLTKESQRKLTDVIQQVLIPLAIKQGSKNANRYYKHYSQLINKALGIESDSRDNLSPELLFELNKMNDMAAVTIEELADKEIDYHDIYPEVKQRIGFYAKTSMFKQRFLK